MAPVTGALAMGLVVTPQDAPCVAEASVPPPLIPQPAQANQRLANSQAVAGRLDVALAWLGNPTVRYPHRALDVSNHRMGAVEQDLAVVVPLPGQRPTIVVPDMTLRALHALRWDASGRWVELSDVKPLPDRVERLVPMPGAACALLYGGRYAAVRLMP